MRFLLTLITLFLFFVSVPAMAQEVDLSKNETQFGHKVTATITVNHPPEQKVKFVKTLSLPDSVELKSKTVTPFKGGSILTIELMPLATGEISFPGVGIKIVKPDGSSQIITSDSFSFSVKSMLGGGILPEPKPIKKQAEVKADWMQILWPEILLLLVPVLLYLLYKRFKSKFKRKEYIPPPPTPERPEVIALRKIDQLSEKKLLMRGEIKPHFYELSQILREYLEERIGIPALEMTTHELSQARSVSADSITLLKMCDHAKYKKKTESGDDDGTKSARTVIRSCRNAGRGK